MVSMTNCIMGACRMIKRLGNIIFLCILVVLAAVFIQVDKNEFEEKVKSGKLWLSMGNFGSGIFVFSCFGRTKHWYRKYQENYIWTNWKYGTGSWTVLSCVGQDVFTNEIFCPFKFNWWTCFSNISAVLQ